MRIRFLQNIPFRLGALFLISPALALGPTVVRAQGIGGIDMTGTGGGNTIQGRINFPSGRRSDRQTVVRLQSNGLGDHTAMSDTNGSFSFRGLAPGSYTVVIEATDDYEAISESVYIDPEISSPARGISLPSTSRIYSVQITLRPKTPSARSAPGVVDVALANVPKEAAELYRRARSSEQSGDSKAAVEQLKSAISIYPSFALALNELGVQYLKLGQAEKAIDVLGRAVKIVPQDYSPRLNYGIALLEKKELSNAEEQLRQAVRLNGQGASGHLYLGIALATQKKLDEGEQELKSAIELGGNSMNQAHYYLGGVYWGRREYEKAADELEAYLKEEPQVPDANRIRETIKELRAKKD